jgi:hypothetical protein
MRARQQKSGGVMWCCMLIIAAACLASISTTRAQTRTVEDDQDLINWYYAATYGTGIYSAGDRTVGVLKIPLSRTLRESGDDQWGLRLILPITFGLYDFSFDSVVDDGLPTRVNTLSFVPGLEFEKRVVPRWLLKPYVTAGAGWELDGDESAVIYDAGLRSRYRMGNHNEAELSLVNRLSLAGYYPSGGHHEPLGMFAIGVDLEVPFGGALFGRSFNLSILPVYYYYFRRLHFAEFDEPDNKIREEVELALSVLTKKPFSVFGMKVDRVGVAVRTSADVQGFRIFTTLPF